MTEQTPVGELEKQLGSHPSRFEVAQNRIVPKTVDDLPSKVPEIGKEDFTDPNHPLYGEVDEYGRQLPGWLEQITIRWDAPLGAFSRHPVHLYM